MPLPQAPAIDDGRRDVEFHSCRSEDGCKRQLHAFRASLPADCEVLSSHAGSSGARYWRLLVRVRCRSSLAVQKIAQIRSVASVNSPPKADLGPAMVQMPDDWGAEEALIAMADAAKEAAATMEADAAPEGDADPIASPTPAPTPAEGADLRAALESMQHEVEMTIPRLKDRIVTLEQEARGREIALQATREGITATQYIADRLQPIVELVAGAHVLHRTDALAALTFEREEGDDRPNVDLPQLVADAKALIDGLRGVQPLQPNDEPETAQETAS